MLVNANALTYERGKIVAVIASSTSKYEIKGLFAPPVFNKTMTKIDASANKWQKSSFLLIKRDD